MTRLRQALVLAVIAVAGLGACAGRETPNGGTDAAIACETDAPPPGCEQTVQRLNDALMAALKETVPAKTALESNMELQSHPGAKFGVTFFAVRDENDEHAFEAPVRLRLGDRVGTLDVWVHRYTVVPDSDDCPDKERLAEMASKGMAQNQCDRHKAGDAVVLVHDSSEPHGSGDYATMIRHNLAVSAYRADGTRVDVTLSPAVEAIPDDAAARAAIMENILTLEQLESLALNQSLIA